MGTKIYVCRVDNTHLQVLHLASEMNVLEKKLKNKDADTDLENANRSVNECLDDSKINEDGEESKKNRKKKKVRVTSRMLLTYVVLAKTKMFCFIKKLDLINVLLITCAF